MWPLIIILLGVLVTIYKIHDAFKNDQSFFDCYIVSYMTLVAFVAVGSLHPMLRSNESLGYFLIYIPMFALLLLPFTLIPVIIAHIIYAVKRRIRPSIEGREKVKWPDIISVVIFIVGFALMFVPIPLVGFLMSTGVCVYRVIRFIFQKT